MSKLDIARALKDQTYFDSLSSDEQKRVREAGGVGGASVTDSDLESVSGGLEGGFNELATTTSSDTGCTACGESDPGDDNVERFATIICTC